MALWRDTVVFFGTVVVVHGVLGLGDCGNNRNNSNFVKKLSLFGSLLLAPVPAAKTGDSSSERPTVQERLVA